MYMKSCLVQKLNNFKRLSANVAPSEKDKNEFLIYSCKVQNTTL